MPDWKPEIRRRLAGLKLAPTREAAIVEELAQHLDDYYAELLAGGATEAEACQQTLAELICAWTLTSAGISSSESRTAGENERAEVVWGGLVSGNYFDVMGVNQEFARRF